MEGKERNIRYVLGWFAGRLSRDVIAVRREILNGRGPAVTMAGDAPAAKRKRAAAAALFGIVYLLPVGLADFMGWDAMRETTIRQQGIWQRSRLKSLEKLSCWSKIPMLRLWVEQRCPDGRCGDAMGMERRPEGCKPVDLLVVMGDAR